jgi:hypothetical protein
MIGRCVKQQPKARTRPLWCLQSRQLSLPTEISMNVFILCAGRCGSLTLSRALSHATNFTSGHETRVRQLGYRRVDYPINHIEADNRLAFFLGRLDNRFGRDAYYVHLGREREACAASHNRRWEKRGMMRAYAQAILNRRREHGFNISVCHDYLRTVEENIEFFLRDKPHQMNLWLETLDRDFPTLWQWIGAEGDLDTAMRELNTSHNAARRKHILARKA